MIETARPFVPRFAPPSSHCAGGRELRAYYLPLASAFARIADRVVIGVIPSGSILT
jgi:hypothetical protein